jgi:translation initiation factor IF-3
MLGVMPTAAGLKLALEKELDLVEVSPNTNPPVAKILDYDKFRYQQEKQTREARKKIKKIVVKNIRLSVRIGDHDFNFRLKQANEFITEGNKVKIDIRMRGREQAHPELAFDLMKKFISQIGVPNVVEAPVSRMGGVISSVVGPAGKQA